MISSTMPTSASCRVNLVIIALLLPLAIGPLCCFFIWCRWAGMRCDVCIMLTQTRLTVSSPTQQQQMLQDWWSPVLFVCRSSFLLPSSRLTVSILKMGCVEKYSFSLLRIPRWFRYIAIFLGVTGLRQFLSEMAKTNRCTVYDHPHRETYVIHTEIYVRAVNILWPTVWSVNDDIHNTCIWHIYGTW